MNRCLGMFAGTILALMLTVAPASSGPEPCSGCTLLGSLSVGLSSIEPSQPMVDEVVTFTFTVGYALPSGFDCGLNGSCAFIGGEPFLEGSEAPHFEAAGLVVRRRAAQAGVATVRLELTGETEEACRFEDASGCSTFFQPAFIDASTGPIEVTVVEAPTPTPTPTPTPNRATDDDGCAISTARHDGTWPLAFLVLPFLLLTRVTRR